MLDIAITEPTDRSIPPIISTIVIVQATTIFTETCRATLIRLLGVRKVGEATERIMNKITRKAI